MHSCTYNISRKRQLDVRGIDADGHTSSVLHKVPCQLVYKTIPQCIYNLMLSQIHTLMCYKVQLSPNSTTFNIWSV